MDDLWLPRVLRPESFSSIRVALQTDAVARRILAKAQSPEDGELVGVRLNINVLKRTGVAVHSLHKATSKDGHTRGKGFYKGEVFAYLPVVTLRNAWFNVHQDGREAIASGLKPKFPMASVDGEFVRVKGKANFDGVEVSFNPKSVHLFVDSKNQAVSYAKEVTILGHRAYARGVHYFSRENAPTKTGGAFSGVVFKS
jgi:hypothetical protein